MNTFRAVVRPASWEQELHRSRFIGWAYPAPDEQAVATALAELSQRYRDATHLCFGGVVGGGRQAGPARERFSDAGEPSGTAGRPILEVVRRQGLVETFVAVVRYFGGIRLGAPGLVRAYSGTAAGVLAVAQIAEFAAFVRWELTLPYAAQGLLRPRLEAAGVQWLGEAYTDVVHWQLAVPPLQEERLRREIATVSSGQLQPQRLGTLWRPVQ